MRGADTSPVPNRSKSISHRGNEASAHRSAGDAASQPAGGLTRRRGRLGPFAEPNFRVFSVGYATSLLRTAISTIALTFAVLDAGHSPADLGVLFAANLVPLGLVM